MRIVVLTTMALALSAAACGHSQREDIASYCRGRLVCGIDTSSSPDAVDDCVEGYLNPSGTPHEQCVTTETAACLGPCYNHAGCAMFDVNDPCSCEHKSYDCPE